MTLTVKGGAAGYTPIQSDLQSSHAPVRGAGNPAMRAEQRPTDVPSSRSTREAEGTQAERANIGQLKSVSQEEQTPVEREATKATAEKPSLLRRAFRGVVGALMGAVGGLGAGIYATGGLCKVIMDFCAGAPAVGAAACAATLIFGGGALIAAGIVGGLVSGAVHGARAETFGEAAGGISVPVDWVTRTLGQDKQKESPASAST